MYHVAIRAIESDDSWAWGRLRGVSADSLVLPLTVLVSPHFSFPFASSGCVLNFAVLTLLSWERQMVPFGEP